MARALLWLSEEEWAPTSPICRGGGVVLGGRTS